MTTGMHWITNETVALSESHRQPDEGLKNHDKTWARNPAEYLEAVECMPNAWKQAASAQQ
jgi:hypothetical protein